MRPNFLLPLSVLTLAAVVSSAPSQPFKERAPKVSQPFGSEEFVPISGKRGDDGGEDFVPIKRDDGGSEDLVPIKRADDGGSEDLVPIKRADEGGEDLAPF